MRQLVLAVAFVAACTPTGGDDDGGGGGGDDGSGSGSGGSGGGGACFSPPVLGQANPEHGDVQSCAIWNHVDNMVGELRLTREGTNLTLEFANNLVFTGTLSAAGAVHLENVQPHSWTDGCTWQSTEVLTGTVDAACGLQLAYSYTEMVIEDAGMCDTPCTGTADVTLDITPVVQ